MGNDCSTNSTKQVVDVYIGGVKGMHLLLEHRNNQKTCVGTASRKTCRKTCKLLVSVPWKEVVTGMIVPYSRRLVIGF